MRFYFIFLKFKFTCCVDMTCYALYVKGMYVGRIYIFEKGKGWWDDDDAWTRNVYINTYIAHLKMLWECCEMIPQKKKSANCKRMRRIEVTVFMEETNKNNNVKDVANFFFFCFFCCFVNSVYCLFCSNKNLGIFSRLMLYSYSYRFISLFLFFFCFLLRLNFFGLFFVENFDNKVKFYIFEVMQTVYCWWTAFRLFFFYHL